MGIDSVSSMPAPSIEMALKTELAAAGLIAGDARWRPFAGGRTNAIWKVGGGSSAIVCKLYSAAADSPLFPNDADAEALSLTALAGTGLAPELIAAFRTSQGPCLLYRHVEGRSSGADVTEVAGLLTQLHRQKRPSGFRRIPSGAEALRRQGLAILNACSSPRAVAIRNACPDCRAVPTSLPVFLHGDVVPANIVRGRGCLTLIDWQCPAIGDPAEDLATFLSPAMQTLYGGRVVTEGEQNRFLDAYGNPAAAECYLALKPLFHWRMAAHCLWKAERRSVDYAKALELELAELDER